jgi:hypothetical protein
MFRSLAVVETKLKKNLLMRKLKNKGNCRWFYYVRISTSISLIRSIDMIFLTPRNTRPEIHLIHERTSGAGCIKLLITSLITIL